MLRYSLSGLWFPLTFLASCLSPESAERGWAEESHEDETGAPESDLFDWIQVAAGKVQTCGLTEGGPIDCWGGERLDGYTDTGSWVDYGDDDPPDDAFVSVGLSTGAPEPGSWHGCAISAEGSITCWGRNNQLQASPPAGEYTSLALGAYFSCALTEDGEIDCWGENDILNHTPSGAGFDELAAGKYQSCAVHSSGYVSCWSGDETQVDREGPYIDVAVYSLVCALDLDGAVSCWERNDGPVVNPEGLPTADGFTEICVGWGHSECVLSAEGSVVCWGDELVEAPDDLFSQLSCGTHHVCGVTFDGDILCWGGCDDGECDVPP